MPDFWNTDPRTRPVDEDDVRAATEAWRAQMDNASLIYFAYGQAAADHYLATGETPALEGEER